MDRQGFLAVAHTAVALHPMATPTCSLVKLLRSQDTALGFAYRKEPPIVVRTARQHHLYREGPREQSLRGGKACKAASRSSHHSETDIENSMSFGEARSTANELRY